MEPRLPIDQILNLLGLTPEKIKAAEQRIQNDPQSNLIGATAVGTFGNPRMKEASSFYTNRYPQMIDALLQPGIRNKVNAGAAALANEGTNMLGDALINEGLPLVAGMLGSMRSPQVGNAAYAGTKTVAPWINLVKDAVQSDYVDPKMYEAIDKVNVAQHIPSVHDLTGLVTKNPVARNVITGIAHHALDDLDQRITGWAADQRQKHPTPTIVEPIKKTLTSDIPKNMGQKGSARQVIKPLNDAAMGKKPWKNAFEQAVMGALYPDKMMDAEHLAKQKKFNEYGRTALGGK